MGEACSAPDPVARTTQASASIVQLRALALRNLAGMLMPPAAPLHPAAPHAPPQVYPSSPLGVQGPPLHHHYHHTAPQAQQQQQPSEEAILEALALYGEAVTQPGTDADDGLLWGGLADAAGRAGQLGLARFALEAGVAAAPHNQLLLERAMEVRFASKKGKGKGGRGNR